MADQTKGFLNTALTTDIWLVDLQRRLPTRFTTNSPNADSPIWSPDGSRIVFNSDRKGHSDLYEKLSRGTSAEDVLFVDNSEKFPTSWSPDGQFILYHAYPESSQVRQADLWLLPLSGDRKPVPFLQTPFNERFAQFSPNSRYVAYQSNESGRTEVYVVPFARDAAKVRVSAAGGFRPRWRRDGKEVFFLAPDRTVMASTVNTTGSALDVGTARALRVRQVIDYAVSGDGQRFLTTRRDEDGALPPFTVVVNWLSALKK